MVQGFTFNLWSDQSSNLAPAKKHFLPSHLLQSSWGQVSLPRKQEGKKEVFLLRRYCQIKGLEVTQMTSHEINLSTGIGQLTNTHQTKPISWLFPIVCDDCFTSLWPKDRAFGHAWGEWPQVRRGMLFLRRRWDGMGWDEMIVRDLQIWCPHRRGEGGHGKADVVREVVWILKYKSAPNADKGREGVKKSENFADIISGNSHSWPRRKRVSPRLIN